MPQRTPFLEEGHQKWVQSSSGCLTRVLYNYRGNVSFAFLITCCTSALTFSNWCSRSLVLWEHQNVESLSNNLFYLFLPMWKASWHILAHSLHLSITPQNLSASSWHPTLPPALYHEETQMHYTDPLIQITVIDWTSRPNTKHCDTSLVTLSQSNNFLLLFSV